MKSKEREKKWVAAVLKYTFTTISMCGVNWYSFTHRERHTHTYTRKVKTKKKNYMRMQVVLLPNQGTHGNLSFQSTYDDSLHDHTSHLAIIFVCLFLWHDFSTTSRCHEPFIYELACASIASLKWDYPGRRKNEKNRARQPHSQVTSKRSEVHGLELMVWMGIQFQ